MNARVSVGGSRKERRVTIGLATLCVGLLVLVTPAAVAAPCAGFTDLEDTSAFCTNVEWARNRSITLGCTSATLYCPNEPVDRMQIAAVMNRLGVALTPVDLPTVEGNIYEWSLTPPVYMCLTTFQVTTFPRRAFLRANALTWGTWDNIVFAAELVYAVNNQASWTSLPDSAMFQTIRVNGARSVYPFGALDLEVGNTYVFGVQMWDASNSPIPFVFAVGCTLDVQIGNRNSASPPF